VRHHEAAAEGADGGSPADGGDEKAVGEATIFFLKRFAEDFGAGGEDDSFADAEEEAHGKEGGEAAGESGEDGGGRPCEESGGEYSVGAEAIDEPADGDLEEDVGPEEGGEENAELRGGEAPFFAEERGGEGEVTSVDVVDEDCDDQQGDDGCGALRTLKNGSRQNRASFRGDQDTGWAGGGARGGGRDKSRRWAEPGVDDDVGDALLVLPEGNPVELREIVGIP
jgi:hypothetical protein